MNEYLHGAFGRLTNAPNKVAKQSRNGFCYIGTAPVHTVEGGAENVNKPVLVNSIAEAKKLFGWSDDFAKYTLCEAMYAHLMLKGVGPIILINVLDTKKHKAVSGGTESLTPKNGKIVIQTAADVILDSVKVQGKTKGEDFGIVYDSEKKIIVIGELKKGALGSEALQVTYEKIDATKVTETDVIGASDGEGTNTGMYAVKNVYQMTGRIPAYILAPGFSSMPKVHEAMLANARQINGHFDAYLLVDMPIVDKSNPLKLSKAKEWKEENGYNKDGETVFFPLVKGVDGRTYHLSVLSAVNLQALLIENDGIPYMTASNTTCEIIKNLYLGEQSEGRIFDDEIINEHLNKHGIASAAFVGGKWVLWGCHSANYEFGANDPQSAADTNRMMLYYISNDFQERRANDVDKPMTKNDFEAIKAQEQARLDALVKTGMLSFGKVRGDVSEITGSDIVKGDYVFAFDITTTPLAKSVTALVNWTDEGFQHYFVN